MYRCQNIKTMKKNQYEPEVLIEGEDILKIFAEMYT